MSHSTTATSTYVLQKYSRSYPVAQSNPISNADINTADWQHFTNPTLRLVLDVKKASASDLESVRLRILWSMDSGDLTSADPDKREVVFEDIDMLSLSCQRRLPNQQVLALPLKAVYRDMVVGIRYLHVSVTAVTPVYRRFQITFISRTAASEFIDSIKTVCPCKANPVSVQSSAVDNRTSLSSSTNTRQNILRTSDRYHATLASAAPPTEFIQTSTSMYKTPLLPSSRLLSSNLLPSGHPLPNTTTTQLGNDLTPAPHPANDTLTPHVFESTVTQTVADPQIANHITENPQGQRFPSLTLTNNISQAALMRTDSILNTLREDTGLYNLPHASLENLVRGIVREDGFARLMEDIASMWQMNKYINI